MPYHVVVALDGSDVAERVLPHVALLSEAFRPAVTMVRAFDAPTPGEVGTASSFLPSRGPMSDPKRAIEEGRKQVDAYLADVAERLSASGVPAEPLRADGSAAASILAVARERGATLISMTTHGRGGLGRLLLGSVAETVLRAAPCPVLLVRVTAGDEPAGDAVGAEGDRAGRDRAGRPEEPG
jgi:nucleotide-binding universal stress UspA family protein